MRYTTKNQIRRALAELPQYPLQCTGSLSVRRNRSTYRHEGTACNWRNTGEPGRIDMSQTYDFVVIGPCIEVAIADGGTGSRPCIVATCRLDRQRVRWTFRTTEQPEPRRQRALSLEERRIAEFFRTL